ncbi:MAG: WD40 repeat domain-containing serine/threonine-protein kinase [Pirellulales bacterium]
MPSPEELDHQLALLLDAYERSLAFDFRVDDVELIARHPQLAPRLAREIRKRRLVHGARLAAQGQECEAPQASPSTHPRIFGDFELLETLGRGGMGIVYKARQISLGRIVAIKMLRLAAMASDEDLKRFKAEAAAAARLSHPNIVAVHDAGIEAEGTPRETPYFCMEFVEGQSLQEFIREVTLDPRRSAELLAEVADAIQFAHERGVLHRDLKPANILLDTRGRPRVTDFGLAKQIAGSDELTRSGDVIGTPAYMSPEQAYAAHGEVGPRSDVYSLGATLYACLTLRPPFIASTRDEVLVQVRHDDPLAPRQIQSRIPRDLEIICLKCLEKVPARRYSSAGEMADDLRRFLRGESIVARPAGRLEQTLRWCRRQPWRAAALVLTLAAVLLLSLLGIGGTLAARQQSQLRRDAEIRREESERNLALALVRQTQHSQALARLQLDSRRYAEANLGLATVPKQVASWDTWRLRHEARLGPELQGSFVSGYWSVLDFDLHAASNQLVTVDASGLIVVWNVLTGLQTQQLTNPRKIKRRDDAPLRLAHHFESRDETSHYGQWPDGYVGVRWLPAGDAILALALHGRVDSMSLKTGEKHELLSGDEPLVVMELDAAGEHLLVGGNQGGLWRHRVANLQAARTSTELAQRSPASSPGAAISAIVSLEQQRWLVGREDGGIQVLDHTLAELGTAQVAAPVWSLASDGHGLVVAGCAAAVIPIFDMQTDGQLKARDAAFSLQEHGRETSSIRATATHALALDSKGDRLYVGDDLGVLHGWDMRTGRILAREAIFRSPHHARRLLNDIEARGPEWRLPLPYRRRFSKIALQPTTSQLVAAADNATVQLWRLKEQETTNVREFADRAGPNPRLAFDPLHPEWLWAFDQLGQLAVFDSMSGLKVAQRAVHAQGRDIAISRSAIVLTAGEEKTLGRWRFDPERREIVAASLPALTHDRALLSCAVSPNEQWAASVDERSQLVVWDWTTGQIRHRDALSADMSRPATGRVAFNCDSTWLAAFGAGHSAPLYRLEPFAPSGVHLAPSGRGGRALAWSPSNHQLVRGVDDYRRLFQTWTNGLNASLLTSIDVASNSPRESCQTIVATPDGRRWVQLEEGGRIVFTSHDQFVPLYEFQSPRRFDADLAFDRTTRRMALAHQDGSLAIWETGREVDSKRDAPVDDAWDVRDLLPSTDTVLHAEIKNIQFDPQGRLTALLHENRDNQPLALFLLRDEKPSPLFERVDAASFDAAGGIHFTGAKLAWFDSTEPTIAVRRTTPSRRLYDGALLIGHRDLSSRWTFETVAPSGNWGHYPCFGAARGGDVTELFHFGYDGSFLRRSFRDGNQWRTEIVGDWGSGMALDGAVDHQGALHMVYSPERFPRDRPICVYAVWKQGQLSTETITFRPGVIPSTFQLSPQGTPHIGRTERGNLIEILRREGDRWQTLVEPPPSIGQYPATYALGEQGEVYLVELVEEAARWELRLLTWDQKRWDLRRIQAEVGTEPPSDLKLLIDAQGQPALVVGKLRQPRGWLKLLRPKR